MAAERLIGGRMSVGGTPVMAGIHRESAANGGPFESIGVQWEPGLE